jgi:ankyrin repeat domain-containing protein 50
MSKRHLTMLLASLPRSLSKTYERMLLSIPEESAEEAKQILTMLCCAKRPLTVPELIEVIAVELGDDPRLNIDGRLDNEDEIYRVCPGFIEVDARCDGEQATVRIAHFSVQEYLESDLLSPEVAKFGVRQREAHTEIACICLTYLLEPALLDSENSTEYPLAHYAAQSWYKHVYDGEDSHHLLRRQTFQLFQNLQGELENCIRIQNIDQSNDREYNQIALPIYYASLLGLEFLLEPLLEAQCADVNTQGGRYGNALQAASAKGHIQTVKLLLARGPKVNAQGGWHVNALQAASVGGHDNIVELLLAQGANFDSETSGR